MNLPQAKIALEKIITLYKTLSADEKNISPIERDLMLSYVRQLYETFLDTPSVSANYQKAVQPEPTPRHKPEPERFVPPPPEPVRYTPPPPAVEQARPEPVRQPVVEQPRYTPPPVEQPRYTPPPVEQPRYTPPPVEQPKFTTTLPPAETPRYVAQNSAVPAEIEVLFEGGNSGKELSDRLSNTAIADLSKAFGLNDRLLTQNELFGGSKAVFDEALKDLNNMSSFETAKNSIVSMATRYNWTATEDRKKQAKSFIKLVRRRFS